MVIRMLPTEIGFFDALHVAGSLERLNVVDFNFDLRDR